MTAHSKMRLHVTAAALAGLGLRLWFVWRFPFYDASDTPIYQQLASNWLRHGVYGLELFGRLTPVDIRTPGYPAFLAGIYAVFGESAKAVMIAQAVIGVATCFLAAAIAATLAPRESRRRAAFIALWLAALCPFTANYAAVVLTETLAIFLSALALLVLVLAIRDVQNWTEAKPSQTRMKWLLGGIVAGLGALVRPETPLVLAGIGVALVAMWWRPRNWRRLAEAIVLMAIGVVIPLLPWAARNWRTLHEGQFLAPFHSEIGDEYVPRGFYSWEKTWLWRFGDVFLVSWNLDGDEIQTSEVRSSAFDSSAERARITELLSQYNETKEMTPELDRQFADIARERTARHPLRTYVEIPFLRALTMWFTPRIEMLPLSGKLWPIGYWWEDSESQYCISLGLFLLGIAYGVMALGGALRSWRDPVAVALIAFIVIRTAFLTTVETPEPRYVLECFPAVFALAAQLWRKRRSRYSSGHPGSEKNSSVTFSNTASYRE